MSLLGRGWKGGSAKATVKGYVTRKGKRVKAHTRGAAARQAKQASNQILGRAVTRIITGKQGRLIDRALDELWKALQPKPAKGKGRGRK